MKIFAQKLIVFSIIAAIFAASPHFLLAQERLMGELVITKTSPEGFVLINNEQAVSGRSITSPAEITTSPQAGARVVLAQTGTVLLSPNTKMNLSFISSSISGDLLSGEITVETLPNTTLNLLTPDGTVTITNKNQSNVVKVAVENNRSRVQTLTGEARFNDILISAGEFYPQPTGTQVNTNRSSGLNPLLLIGIIGAVAGAALIALTVSSGDGDTPTASPTR
jgi:hypothetical protein